MANGDNFERSLAILFEETDIFSSATDRLKQIEDNEKNLRSTRSELQAEVDSINAQLAAEIRRHNPNLVVQLDRTGHLRVKYGTRARTLSLSPDVRGRCWIVGETGFDRQFRRYYAECLCGSLPELAKGISSYFKNNYRSMVS